MDLIPRRFRLGVWPEPPQRAWDKARVLEYYVKSVRVC